MTKLEKDQRRQAEESMAAVVHVFEKACCRIASELKGDYAASGAAHGLTSVREAFLCG
jgi:hypothetical protein